MPDEEAATAYRNWSRPAPRPASPLASFLIGATPWLYALAIVPLWARTDPKLSNGWTREPVFSPTTAAVCLWGGGLLAALGLLLGLLLWWRVGWSGRYSHERRALGVAAISSLAALTWWNRQDGYADRYPPTLLVPIAVAALTAVVSYGIYRWSGRGAGVTRPGGTA